MRTNAGDGSNDAYTLARWVAASGLVSVLTGAFAWLLVRAQMADERIVVAGPAKRFAGRPVRGPFTAYAEADVIKRLALEATGGRTYGELPEGDPTAKTAMEASLLRASLFTSILAFGIAAAQMALGGVLLLVGAALRRVSGSASPRPSR